ncbi:MAG: hypothetical protein J2P31_04710 [Blastocatellia bacterium]|nr:hypothetical protein [Blastocatellia bacterium]MBO0798104.1 hypothetical protein [Blastocatellia bacterium]
MKPILVAVKNVLLWSHERGSWQYDILCLLIVAIIFIIPSRFFEDRDRLPATSQANGKGIASNASWTKLQMKLEIEKSELQEFLQNQNKIALIDNPREALPLYLRDHFKREVVVLDQRESTNSEGQIIYNVTFK